MKFHKYIPPIFSSFRYKLLLAFLIATMVPLISLTFKNRCGQTRKCPERKKDMKKKVMSAVLAAAMVVGMAGNVVTVSAKEKYDLTLYSVNTTDPDFEDWLANVEDATGLNINVIAAPTDTDTRQQKITTMLSTGDTSVDVIEINDEMSAAFKNSGWLEGLNDTVMTDDIADQFAQNARYPV